MSQNHLLWNFLVACVLLVVVEAVGDCPDPSRVLNCTPKCRHDSECSSGKCCRNICNEFSCAQHNVLVQSGSNYKSPADKQSNVIVGSDCGGKKCSVFEKCIMDRITKRYKCVRFY